MSKIFIADKPTLDEVNEKVSQIVTGERKFFTVDDLFEDNKLRIGAVDVTLTSTNTLTTVLEENKPGILHTALVAIVAASAGSAKFTLNVSIDGKIVCNKFLNVGGNSSVVNGFLSGNLLSNTNGLIIPASSYTGATSVIANYQAFIGPKSEQNDNAYTCVYSPKPLRFNSNLKVEVSSTFNINNTLKILYMYELD